MKSLHWSCQPDLGLLFLRLAGAFMLLVVHGLPKALNVHHELQVIDDPLGIGAWPTLLGALFAQIFCPLLIAVGLLTRLACLPILFLLLVAMLLVHPEWSLLEGQFGWLLLSIFSALAIAGPGRYSLDGLRQRKRYSTGLAGGLQR